MTNDAIDQSWGRVSPAAAKAAGIKLISGYLSHDPSKNWTADRIKGYHAAGIGVLLNWESLAGRPLLGRQAGLDDAAEFVQQAQTLIKAVGYSPSTPIAAVFSCDRDTTPLQYPAIDAYYRATKSVVGLHGFLNGCYGEADVIEHLHAAGLTVVEWQTLAWSRGYISPEADLYQSAIDKTLGGAAVDLDQIRHISTVGAWWPPVAAVPTPALPAGTTPASMPPIHLPPSQKADAMHPRLLVVDKKTVPAGKAWPGDFLQGAGDLSLHHVVDPASFNAYKAAGSETVTITYAEYDAYRREGMIHAPVKA